MGAVWQIQAERKRLSTRSVVTIQFAHLRLHLAAFPCFPTP